KFLGCKFYSLSCTLDLSFYTIELQICDREHGSGRQVTPSQKRANSCRKLGERKRFAHVIASAQIEALYAVLNSISAGQDENGHAGLARAQVPQDGNSIYARQV